MGALSAVFKSPTLTNAIIHVPERNTRQQRKETREERKERNAWRWKEGEEEEREEEALQVL